MKPFTRSLAARKQVFAHRADLAGRARLAMGAGLLYLATAACLTGFLSTRSCSEEPPTLLWTAPGVANVVSLAVIQDIDGDGGPDVLFESFNSGAPANDHLFAIRGRSSGAGEVLWSARPLGGPSNSGGYGDNCLRVGADLNDDGFPDVLYGAAWGSRTAFALDGRTGATEWKFDTYAQSPPSPPRSGWIYAMASLGQDIDGDGVDEVLFCSGSENDGVYCASGRTGEIIWRYQGQDAFYDVVSIEDLNGDGIRDVLAGQGDNYPRIVALSGAGFPGGGAHLLWFRTSGSVFSIARLEDITGDGIPEVVTANWSNSIYCYNGANGDVVWTGNVGRYGMRAVTLDDVNGDGIEDIAYASWDNAARVYSGADGALLWRTPVGTLNGGDVWAIDRLGDVTGDGINDLVCGSFDTYVYAMDGVTGQIVWRHGTGNRLYCVRGVPDISGNGVPDVIAGTQKVSGGGGGICYALEGGTTTSVGGGVNVAGARLGPAFPNPFTRGTSWDLQVDRPGRLEAAVFAPDGRRVAVLYTLGEAPSGAHRMYWNGRDQSGASVPSGVYYARIFFGGAVAGEQRVVRIR